MKKTLALLIALLLLCALPALTEARLSVAVDALGQTLRLNAEGPEIPELEGRWVGKLSLGPLFPDVDAAVTVAPGGAGESPFTMEYTDGGFTIRVNGGDDHGLVDCGGTWALDGDALTMDIRVALSGGETFSCAAEFERN